jgi:hypothetical protein
MAITTKHPTKTSDPPHCPAGAHAYCVWVHFFPGLPCQCSEPERVYRQLKCALLKAVKP